MFRECCRRVRPYGDANERGVVIRAERRQHRSPGLNAWRGVDRASRKAQPPVLPRSDVRRHGKFAVFSKDGFCLEMPERDGNGDVHFQHGT